jgi:hypothetical protein
MDRSGEAVPDCYEVRSHEMGDRCGMSVRTCKSPKLLPCRRQAQYSRQQPKFYITAVNADHGAQDATVYLSIARTCP